MSIVVKVMSGENLPDHDHAKTFRIFSDVSQANIERRGNGTSDDQNTFDRPWLNIFYTNGECVSFQPQGNVYIMNGDGVTIATHRINR